MKKTIIDNAPSSPGEIFLTSTNHTDLSQRETLERTIINLGTCLGADVVYKKYGARGETYYALGDAPFCHYQSASNTILEMSEKLLDRSRDQKAR